MSHFAVIVIGDDVEKQLAPYQEDVGYMNESDKQYVEFCDEEEHLHDSYDNEEVDCVQTMFGEIRRKYDKRNLLPQEDGKCLSHRDRFRLPEGAKEVKVKYSDLYATFDEFALAYHGDERDPETGKYGYWSNTNAKWDWYVVGGRWHGFFKLKDNSVGLLGEPGLFCDRVDRNSGYADIALKRDIDYEGMRQRNINSATNRWNEAFRKYPNMSNPEADSNNLRAREMIYGIGKDVTQEQLVEEASVACPIIPFAVVKDGEWHEKGQMGWFGMASNEKSEEDWEAQFKELFDSLPDDTLLTVVDCHI